MKYKITVVGAGYVGMSLSVLLSRLHHVTLLDIDKSKIDDINKGKSTIKDDLIDHYLKKNNLNLIGTTNNKDAFNDSDFIVIATPTDYDHKTNYFNTTSIENVVEKVHKFNSNALIVIKSTIPVGFTDKLCKKHNTDRIVFSPEFLREGQALYDNLHPSRIIVGSKTKKAITFMNMLKDCSKEENVKLLSMSAFEAESVKLFANSYLAMRVAFFNELDSFAYHNNLYTKNIIDGVSLDKRIGHYYNNPSFGYGGYCLPKDTKQLLSNYKDVPQNIIRAIVDSNDTRKSFLLKEIKAFNPKVIGIYKLAMKSNSDNFRFSAILDIGSKLYEDGYQIIVFEPTVDQKVMDNGFTIVNDISEFKSSSDLILANRIDNLIEDVSDKVFSRDVYGNN